MRKLLALTLTILAVTNASSFASESKGGSDGSHWSQVCEILYDAGRPVDPKELGRFLTPESADQICEYEGSSSQHPAREVRFSATPFFLAAFRADKAAALQILRAGIDVNKPNFYYLHANYSVFEVENEPNSYAGLKKFAEFFSWDDPAARSIYSQILQRGPNLDIVEKSFDVGTWRTNRKASALGLLLSPPGMKPSWTKASSYISSFARNKTNVLRESIPGRPEECYGFAALPEPRLFKTICE